MITNNGFIGAAQGITATGGSGSTSGSNTIRTFTSSGTFAITALGRLGIGQLTYSPQTPQLGVTTSGEGIAAIQALIVSGGGGGSDNASGWQEGGGGGGGGGLLSLPVTYLGIGSYPVTVGAGGASASVGNDSVFSGLTALGGGYGAHKAGTNVGGNGGSGGGGTGRGNDNPGGSGTPGQGNDGGIGTHLGSGGGGGGAGAAGQEGALGANGGNGLQFSINGTATYYSGGGGGGLGDSGSNGSGGLGGGGNGNDTSPQNGTANSGGGGGGIGHNFDWTGSTGGSGVVIISYPT